MQTLNTSVYLTIFLLLGPIIVQGQIGIEPISPHVFHLYDQGGRSSMKATLVRAGDDAVLIDTMMDSLALDTHRYIMDEGFNLQLIVNTHYHGDHVGGNALFEDVMIAAHENTLRNIENGAPYGPPKTFDAGARPNLLFSKQMTYHLQGIPVVLTHYRTAHTNGDAIVHLPTENVIIVGDIILDAHRTLPFAIDPDGTLEVLTEVVSAMDDETQVVTGHGDIANKKQLEDLIAIMQETMDYVRSGGDIENYPDHWDQWNSDFLSMRDWLKMLRTRHRD